MSLTSSQVELLDSFCQKATRTGLDPQGRRGYTFGPGKDFTQLYELLNLLKIGYFASMVTIPAKDKKGQDIEQIMVHVLGWQGQKLSTALSDYGLQKAEIIQKPKPEFE